MSDDLIKRMLDAYWSEEWDASMVTYQGDGMRDAVRVLLNDIRDWANKNGGHVPRTYEWAWFFTALDAYEKKRLK
jgi:hypothetical protein